MKADDVVVTGIGMVTPLGTTAGETGLAWRAGRCARRTCLAQLAGTSLQEAEVAALPEFDPGQRLGQRRMLKYMSESAVLGCVAAREAAEAAGVRTRFRPERVGLFASAGLAAADVQEALPIISESLDGEGNLSLRLFGEKGLAATNPLLSFKILANMPPCLVSILEGAKGPNYIFTPWEGQTAAALVEARAAVASGDVDCALVGAADSPAHPSTFVYLRQAGLLAETEFPASASAYLVFERAESAVRDGRRAIARVVYMSLSNCDGPVRDPLAPRMGRSFATAPAVLLALACQSPNGGFSITGVDRQEFRAELEAAE